ncbi:hypothetical protein GLOTRDRAFT_129923 [Gloeophyllum trabeum ATCC 11539]|uniref:Uncharacterized protein n=1 Tax=Gloeophyllum trabeum (strain ATCC 11539 / FP-39264 / Madison 617) TaxID=670483 RepID=S7Q4X3_GLOTA|nr:uncharacterized protein GLOTRDRAFT_129923 [Gloeophyllum trabeum ATCC 11539]EPQ54573.1 hypothetical protein GLOTRDRAFT_129923 [Gloeophyllum trabeum ATCC 11539]
MSAPRIDIEPGTPARDWANETILQEAAVNPDPYSTPNLEIPGAYPLTKEDHDPDAQVDPNQLVDRAKQYLPAQEDVAETLQNAGQVASSTLQSAAETAKQYIQAGAATYLPVGNSGDVSLPSTEVNGARPSEHVDGVGALPGRIGEAGVAKLPDEREPQEKQSTLAGVAVTAGEKAAAAQRSVSSTIAGVQSTASQVMGNATSAASDSAQETVNQINGTT